MNRTFAFWCVALISVIVSHAVVADFSVSPFAVNDQPVISGEGTVTISRKVSNGDYTILASNVELPWTDTTGGLFPGKDYIYRIDVEGGDSTELAYTHIVRLERSWQDVTKVRPSVRMIGGASGGGYRAIRVLFNGVTTDFYEHTAASTIGVDFGKPVVARYIRVAPRSGYASRLNNAIFYGANADDFSDANALGTCSVVNGWADIIPTNTADSSCRFFYVTPQYGNASEIEIYGYDFGARVAGFLTNDVPVVDATINSNVDIYRNGALVAQNVTLPWADNGTLSPNSKYTYRVVSTTDSTLDYTTTYEHVIRLGHSWNDVTKIISGYPIISDSASEAYNSNVFDGNPDTWKDPGNLIGVDFIQPRIVTMVRTCPRSGQTGRLDGTVFYGANKDDRSDAVALATFHVNKTAFSYRDFYIANPAPYRYYFTKKASGQSNIAELEFYGYSEKVKSIDIVVFRGENDYRTINSSILFNVNIYRDGSLIANDVALPWIDKATLEPSQKYTYKVEKADDAEVTGSEEYYHLIRLERAWSDTSRLRPSVYSLSKRMIYNSIKSNPDYMYDGDTSTMYPQTSLDGLDFGCKVRVELFRGYRSYITQRYNGSQFYGANLPDFSDEVLLATTDTNYPYPGWYETVPTNTAAYRYYRFVWSPNGGNNMSYFPPAEFELYGKPEEKSLKFGLTGTNDAPVLDAWYDKPVDIYRNDELIANSVTFPWADMTPTLKAGTTYHYKAVPTTENLAAYEGEYFHVVRLERSYEALSQSRYDMTLANSASVLFDREVSKGPEIAQPIFSFTEPVTIYKVGYASIHGTFPERMANMRLFGANSLDDLKTNATEVLHFLNKVSDGQGLLSVTNPTPFKDYQLYNTQSRYSAISELDLYGVGSRSFDIKAANDFDKPYLFGHGDLGIVDIYRNGEKVANQVTLPWVDSESKLLAGCKYAYSLKLGDGKILTREYTHSELIGRTWADLSRFNRCALISDEPTAGLLFDGQSSTYGNFTNSHGTVTLDFGSPILATAARVLPVCINPINSYVVITGANEDDFSDGVTLATAPFPIDDSTWSTFAIPKEKQKKFRYYKFSRSGWSGQVREIQLFGKNRNQLIFMIR